MKIFGKENTFAIQYEFKINPFNEIGLIGETWGEFKLFVQGIDVCQYKRMGKIITYQWNLIYIVEWFSENLKYILDDELFPLPIEGQSSLELLDNCLLFESDNDDEFDAWFDKKYDWQSRHSWFSNRAGSFLPNILFRKVNDKIEIAWNNESMYASEGISFIHPFGIEYVPLGTFESTIKDFVKDFLDNLHINSKNNYATEEIYQKIRELIK